MKNISKTFTMRNLIFKVKSRIKIRKLLGNLHEMAFMLGIEIFIYYKTDDFSHNIKYRNCARQPTHCLYGIL